MKITIIQDDGTVGVDGVFRSVDLSGLDAEIHAVQFDTDKGYGHIEYDADLSPRKDNEQIAIFAPFQIYVQRWLAAAPPPPTPPTAAQLADLARLAEVEQAIKADAVIQSLKAMTSAEFDAWWSANVTTAAQAITVLKRVTRVVIRRLL